jgi:hypothetical protein
MGEYIQSAEWIGPNPISCGFDSRLAYLIPLSSIGRAPGSGPGGSWFEAMSGSFASVAHLAERFPRKEQAGRSSRPGGSVRSWRNGIRAGPRCQWSARAVQVQILSDALNAALAHLAERPSCKGQATRSRRVGGSDGDSANGRPRGLGPRNVGSTPASPARAFVALAVRASPR